MLRHECSAAACGRAFVRLGVRQPRAQDYPTKPITLIVPFPAGGGVDVIGRIVADKLAAELGQPVVIDNRGGAAGVIGTRVAARAAPDGYTLVMATSGSIAINPNLYANPGYQTLKDLSPIGLISSTPIVLMAHPSAPEQSLADVIASAKREPGKLNIGTPPPGTSAYLGAELFKSMAGVDITIVTYRGTGPLTTDLLGGHVKLALNVLAPAMSMLKSGSLQGAGGAGAEAVEPSARRADLGGSRPAGLRVGLELRAAGAGRDAARRSSSGSTARSAPASTRPTCAPGSPPTAAIRCRRRRRNTAPTSSARTRRWGALIRKLNLKVE